MNSTYAQKSSTLQKAADSTAASVLDSSSQSKSLQRKADMANNASQRAEAPRPNNTGMPDNLKAGIESLSGFSMDDVRVHYNSSKPATVQALAYTQGTDIHVAPGQEKCLPHEAWHVAQQMAGRVSPTTNINGMPVNDNAALEHEADVMGEKAVQYKMDNNISIKRKIGCNALQCAKNELFNAAGTLQNCNFVQNNANNGTLTIPNGVPLYKVWRTLVNAYEKPKDNSGIEYIIQFVYRINGTWCRTDVAFSKERKGYIVSHCAGLGGAAAIMVEGQNVPVTDSQFGSAHESSNDWRKDSSGADVVMGMAGDAASKLIAERGRFECLRNVYSDNAKIKLKGDGDDVTLTPIQIWKSSDSKMGAYRNAVEAAREIKENDFSQLHLINKFKVRIGGDFSKIIGKCTSGEIEYDDAVIIRLKWIVTKLKQAPLYSDYPYRNDELYYAITKFETPYFTLT